MRTKIILIIILISSLAFSQEESSKKKKDKMKFGGNAAIGLDLKVIGGLNDRVVNDSRLNRIGVVETELKILPADSIELEFDLEFDYRFKDINLKKLFVRYNFDNSNARLGFMKKMFSLEEIKGKSDNLFIKKSIIHNILEDFYLFGNDFTAQYRYNFPSYTLIGGYSIDGSNRHFVNLTLLTRQFQKARFVAAGMYMNYKEKGHPDETERKHAFFGNLGMEFDGKHNNFELEGVWGKNPENRSYSTLLGNLIYTEREGIGFFGARFQESFPIKIGRKYLNKIVPIYELSFIDISDIYFQIRPAINFNFTPKDRLQWRTNLDLNFNQNDLISQRVVTAIFVTW